MSIKNTTTPSPATDRQVNPPAPTSDNPTTRQADNVGADPKLTAVPPEAEAANEKTDDGKKKDDAPSPVVPIVACVVLAAAVGIAVAIDAWGPWLGLAVVVAVVAGLVAIGWLWRWGRHQTKTGRSGSRRGSASRRFGSRGNRTGGPAGFRVGSPFGSRSRNRGGRGPGSGTGGRNRRGLGNRLASLVPGTGAWRSRRAGRSGGGRSGRLFGGRGRSGGAGRGGSLLGARFGGSPRSRRGGAGRRSRRGSRGGRGRHRSGTPMGTPSGGLLPKLAAADRKIGEKAFTPAVHSILDAVDTVKPAKDHTDDVADAVVHTPTSRPKATAAAAPHHHEGDTAVSVNRSQFELITETLPGVAKTDPITNHDLGLKPMIQGLARGLDHVAAYIREHTERVDQANWTTEDKIIVQALDAIADVQNTAGPVAEKALMILESSPRWQELQAKMASPKGASADVATGRMAGY